MKKILLLLFFVVIGFNTAFATRHTDDNRLLLRLIRQKLSFTESFKREAAGKSITVYFTITQDATMKVLRVDGADDSVEKAVRERLEGTCVENIPYYEGKEYSFAMNFTKE